MSFPRSAGSTSSKARSPFMAGYGIRAYLIAQSLNQIAKAYGENNAILDNCHVRIAFAANDERTAKRISDALGTATELRAQRNYAGHRLAPWLGHVMVSRQETARPLADAGGGDAAAARSRPSCWFPGLAPVRATKLRHYEDANFVGRLRRPPVLDRATSMPIGLRPAPTIGAARCALSTFASRRLPYRELMQEAAPRKEVSSSNCRCWTRPRL